MNRVEHLLAKGAEECAEIGQRALKAQQFGLLEIQPSGSAGLVNPEGRNNAERIMDEFNDLLGVLEMLEQATGMNLSTKVNRGAIEAKKVKVEYFLRYCREIGTLTD
jgi:hypothetical protein